MSRPRARGGFTLIELLVVIAIIGLLSSIVLASLTAARERAQDARRYSDLRQVGLALQLYRNDTGSFVANSRDVMELTALVPKYIPELPKDPTGTREYRYCSDSRGSSYSLLAYTAKEGWCYVSPGANMCPGGLSDKPRCGQ